MKGLFSSGAADPQQADTQQDYTHKFDPVTGRYIFTHNRTGNTEVATDDTERYDAATGKYVKISEEEKATLFGSSNKMAILLLHLVVSDNQTDITSHWELVTSSIQMSFL